VEYLDLQCPKVRQAVPAWMVDADLCGQMTYGLQPAADLPTLLAPNGILADFSAD
jgi:hypothetical protein